MENSVMVVVVIINWNGLQDTLKCIASLASSVQRVKYSVVLVDNGSTDGSQDQLKQLDRVKLILLNANLGFAAATNIGIQWAIETGAHYVWLLNNDAIVVDGTLDHLLNVAEVDKKVGVVGSKVIRMGSNIVDHVGAKVSEWTSLPVFQGEGEEDRGQFELVRETHYVSGCSLLASVEMIKEIGMMDEGYFLYYEETDWCVRARKLGWKVLYSPKSVVYHKVSSSVNRLQNAKVYYLTRNGIRFIKKNFSHRTPVAVLVAIGRRVLPLLLRGEFAEFKIAGRAIIDAISGKEGAK